MPVELARGLIATALSVWAIWGRQLVVLLDSDRYTIYLHRSFLGTLIVLATIFTSGWVLTNFLGGLYRQTIQKEGRGDIDLIANRLSGETATVEAIVKALAGRQR